ncbi:hypothetical protein B0F90DRAFT_1719078 [Multifurca ochricompacta]|uniref:Uncharacterized protein n=1 Tax=Multifurca ochricompacta TaxID=376703 RepID=A0AAD4QLA3_9AGAM|nr:hypothetical protein B0F90DRAFT_1719078 [Multifurca ochricompacta]
MIAGGTSQEEYLQLLESDIRRQHQALEHAKPLYEWSQQWCYQYRVIRGLNMDFSRGLAAETGWSLQDLLNSPTYCSLHRSHNARLEMISESAVRLLLAKIDVEILSQLENKRRRQKAHAQQIRRAVMTRHYNDLVDDKCYAAVPTLAEFRELPIVKTLQDREDATPFSSDTSRSSLSNPAKAQHALESELKRSKLIGGMISKDLKRWVDTALGKFDAMLGRPNWKSASTRVLHPAERVTSRFICTLCHDTPKQYGTPQSLEFREACVHQCIGRPKKGAAKRKWKAEQFAPDQKAIAVLSQALDLTVLEAENPETREQLQRFGARFVCNSCDSPIVMDFERLAGHCHRHDIMKVTLIFRSETAIMTVDHLYEAGSFAWYSSRNNEAKEIRQTKTFACRHCRYRTLKPTPPRLSRTGDSHVQRWFTFNGLVSHAKERCALSIFVEGTR